MRIRVLGGGWYGCCIAEGLMRRGHEVELHEIAGRLFNGASGANPARLHLGFHYPRSRLTRAMCQEHYESFMEHYGHLTEGVPVNIYAVAAHDSLVDFGTYVQVLKGEVEFVQIRCPKEFGLTNVEGAVLTGERHIVINKARGHFQALLGNMVRYYTPPGDISDPSWDWTIDATFCALDRENVDRYEPCITGLLSGKSDKAVTIMDGPFPSIYPWNEHENLSSITSAKLTPLGRCATYEEAQDVIEGITPDAAEARVMAMVEQMESFWPEAKYQYHYAGYRFGVRAQPRSGSDARLVDIVKIGPRVLRVRAGKIDAVIHAENAIAGMIARG